MNTFMIISMALLAVTAVTIFMLFFDESTPATTANFDEALEKEYAQKKFNNAKKEAQDVDYE